MQKFLIMPDGTRVVAEFISNYVIQGDELFIGFDLTCCTCSVGQYSPAEHNLLLEKLDSFLFDEDGMNNCLRISELPIRAGLQGTL